MAITKTVAYSATKFITVVKSFLNIYFHPSLTLAFKVKSKSKVG